MNKTTAIIAALALASGAAMAGDDIKEKDFNEVDANGDGVVSRSEIIRDTNDVVLAEFFAQADGDRNGMLNQYEYQDFIAQLENQEEEAE